MNRFHLIRMVPGKRLYVNGAVLRFDRNVSVEVSVGAVVLDEDRIMHADDVTSPLRQLYFCVQLMLIDPENVDQSKPVLEQVLRDADRIYQGSTVADGLSRIRDLLDRDRHYDTLIALPDLFEIEDDLRRDAGSAGCGRTH